LDGPRGRKLAPMVSARRQSNAAQINTRIRV
jgi:hypothetical protein